MSESPRLEKQELLTDYVGFLSKAQRAPAGFKYNGMAAFIYAEGVELSAEPFTPEEEAELLSIFRHVRAPKLRGCYETAYNLMSVSCGRVAYAEGFGVGEAGFPLDHAIGVLNGKPVDISWRGEARGPTTRKPEKLLERAKRNLAQNVYHAVVFPETYVNKRALATGVYGIIPGNAELAKFGSGAWTEEEANVG